MIPKIILKPDFPLTIQLFLGSVQPIKYSIIIKTFFFKSILSKTIMLVRIVYLTNEEYEIISGLLKVATQSKNNEDALFISLIINEYIPS